MNPVLLRKQLQDNASDLQDFCKDLKSWGEDMKRKEEALKNGDKDKPTASSKKAKGVAKSNKKTKDIASKKPVTKIGTTDYAAWDKFDADAECEKLEDNNDDSELTDECNENMQDMALIEKEKGNKFVKAQKWDEAIKSYSEAIKYYSYDPIFYANRALCHLKKNNFQDAEKDCTLSLKLDSTYVKAYQRRAAAWEGQNKLEHAEHDLLKVLQFEPKNKESQERLVKVRDKLGKTDKISEQRPVSKFTASRNKSSVMKTPAIDVHSSTRNTVTEKEFDSSKPLPSWPANDDIVLVKPIKKPPHLRSNVPLKRIKIVEKGGVEMESKKIVEFESEAFKQHVFEKREIVPARDVSAVEKRSDVEDSTKNVAAFKRNEAETTPASTAWPRPGQNSLSIASDDFKVVEKDRADISANYNPVVSKEIKNTSNVNISNGSKKTENNDVAKPKTSVQFNLTWKNLKSTEEKYKYFKRVDPQDLPKIFLNSLESNVFSGILDVLVLHFIENKDPVYDVLDGFTRVNRFATFTMFMSSSDKNNLWKLFDYIKDVEQKNKEDVDRLIDKYEL